jgi:hypothetical protein
MGKRHMPPVSPPFSVKTAPTLSAEARARMNCWYILKIMFNENKIWVM